MMQWVEIGPVPRDEIAPLLRRKAAKERAFIFLRQIRREVGEPFQGSAYVVIDRPFIAAIEYENESGKEFALKAKKSISSEWDGIAKSEIETLYRNNQL